MKLSTLFTLGLVAADRLDRLSKEVDVNALDRSALRRLFSMVKFIQT